MVQISHEKRSKLIRFQKSLKIQISNRKKRLGSEDWFTQDLEKKLKMVKARLAALKLKKLHSYY